MCREVEDCFAEDKKHARNLPVRDGLQRNSDEQQHHVQQEDPQVGAQHQAADHIVKGFLGLRIQPFPVPDEGVYAGREHQKQKEESVVTGQKVAERGEERLLASENQPEQERVPGAETAVMKYKKACQEQFEHSSVPRFRRQQQDAQGVDNPEQDVFQPPGDQEIPGIPPEKKRPWQHQQVGDEQHFAVACPQGEAAGMLMLLVFHQNSVTHPGSL